MTVYHYHHIVPKHAGGTDDPSNLIKVTVEEHAELHFARYLEYGQMGDWLAAFSLSGQISHAEATAEARRDWIARNPDHHAKAGRVGGKAPASPKAKESAARLARELGKRPWWNNGSKNTRSWTCPGKEWVEGRIGFRIRNPHPPVVCPHCGKEMVKSNLSRHIQSKHSH
jgi:hypothetical protein